MVRKIRVRESEGPEGFNDFWFFFLGVVDSWNCSVKPFVVSCDPIEDLVTTCLWPNPTVFGGCFTHVLLRP